MTDRADWSELSQTVLGLVIHGEIAKGAFKRDLFMPPFDEAFKVMKGDDAEPLIEVLGMSLYRAVLGAGEKAKGLSKVNWPFMLESAAVNYQAGFRLHGLSQKMMQGEKIDRKLLQEAVDKIEGATIEGFHKATDVVIEESPLFPFGWEPFDTHVGGAPTAGMVLMAGDTGNGKTWKLLKVAAEFAANIGPFGIFTLEQPKEELRFRLELMKIPQKVMKHILINDSAYTIGEMSTICHRTKGLKGIGIDFMELMLKGDDSSQMEASASSSYLGVARLAQRLQIPAFANAQLTKASMGKVYPTLQDVRNTGMSVMLASLVMFLYNPNQSYVGRPDSATLPAEQGIAYSILAKSRHGYVHGSTGAIKIPFNSNMGKGVPGWGERALGFIPLSAI